VGFPNKYLLGSLKPTGRTLQKVKHIRGRAAGAKVDGAGATAPASPAGYAHGERLFSKARVIISKKGSSIKLSKADQTIFFVRIN